MFGLQGIAQLNETHRRRCFEWDLEDLAVSTRCIEAICREHRDVQPRYFRPADYNPVGGGWKIENGKAFYRNQYTSGWVPSIISPNHLVASIGQNIIEVSYIVTD